MEPSSGIPTQKLTQTDAKKYLNFLENRIAPWARVIGQDQASFLWHQRRAIRRNRSGIRQQRPIGLSS